MSLPPPSPTTNLTFTLSVRLEGQPKYVGNGPKVLLLWTVGGNLGLFTPFNV